MSIENRGNDHWQLGEKKMLATSDDRGVLPVVERRQVILEDHLPNRNIVLSLARRDD
jgi:hypothetical protein